MELKLVAFINLKFILKGMTMKKYKVEALHAAASDYIQTQHLLLNTFLHIIIYDKLNTWTVI